MFTLSVLMRDLASSRAYGGVGANARVSPLGEPVLGTASKLSFPLGVSGAVDAWPSFVSPLSRHCPCPGTLRLLFVFVVVRGGTPAALALAASCVSVGFSPSASMNALNELSRSRSGTAHGNRRSIMHTKIIPTLHTSVLRGS